MTYDPRERRVSGFDGAAGGLLWLAMLGALIVVGDRLPDQRAIAKPEVRAVADCKGPTMPIHRPGRG